MAYANMLKLFLAILISLISATPTPTNLAAAEVTAEPDPLLNFKPTLGTCITWCSGADFTGSCAKNFCKDANICVDLGTRLKKKGERDIVENSIAQAGENKHSVDAYDKHFEDRNDFHAHADGFNDSASYDQALDLQERQLSGTPLSMDSIAFGGSTSCMLYKNTGCHIIDEHLRVGVTVGDLGEWGWGGNAVRSFACVRPN